MRKIPLKYQSRFCGKNIKLKIVVVEANSKTDCCGWLSGMRFSLLQVFFWNSINIKLIKIRAEAIGKIV
jgi:hypothetical protein